MENVTMSFLWKFSEFLEKNQTKNQHQRLSINLLDDIVMSYVENHDFESAVTAREMSQILRISSKNS